MYATKLREKRTVFTAIVHKGVRLSEAAKEGERPLRADGHLMLHLVGLISLGAPMKTRLPMLSPLPPVLSPADGVHTFTYDSVQRRLPLIVEAVISNNPDYKPELIASLRSLAAEIATGAPLKPLLSTRSGWPEMLAPLLEEGATWFSAPWWIAENYFCAWTFLEFRAAVPRMPICC
jgi:hypothetical protein